MTRRAELLATLSFGRVDAESVQDLDKRFLQTSDFDTMINTDVSIVLGPKGSGKSTIFELFSRFEPNARQLAGAALNDVIIVTGTGLLDMTEVATEDIEKLKGEAGYDHEKLWRLYIAVKCALALAGEEVHSAGPVREILRATGGVRDFRVWPLLRGLWRALIGPTSPVGGVKISALGASVDLPILGRPDLDVRDLLLDVHTLLAAAGKRIWILFDKIDELYPGDREERRRALQGLLTATMSMRRAFPLIEPKVFLRTDIWSTLEFTNKTHLVDRTIRLTWSRRQIGALIIKGAAASPGVAEHIRSRVPSFDTDHAEVHPRQVGNKVLGLLMEDHLTQHGKKWATLSWLYDRIRDAHDYAFPREAILWLNVAASYERKRGSHMPADTALVTANSLSAAYGKVSVARCETFLAEFSDLQPHFARFEGKDGPVFQRAELLDLMGGLRPSGDEMLRALHEVGVLKPVGGGVVNADRFEVPLLYRAGLLLSTPERI